MHTSIIVALATFGAAVDIQLFFDSPSGDATNCMGDNRVQCFGIAEGECCPIPSYMSADSALFDGLNTGMGYGGLPAYGTVYKPDGSDDDCGTSCNSGYGADLCLSCTEGITGANWFQPRPTRKRDGSLSVTKSTEVKCTRSVEPNLLSLRDAHFNIGRAAGVPEEHTRELYALLSRGTAGLEDVPEHLLVYRNETFVN